MTLHRKGAKSRKMLLGASGAIIISMALSGSAWAEPRMFDIPAEEAVEAIPEFARQAGVQIVAPADQLHGLRTPAVRGTMEPRAALAQLLDSTGLEVASDDGRIITLRVAGAANSPTQLGDIRPAPPSEDAYAEIVVVGRRTLNADIQRTEDGTQPYVVFSSDDIQRSQAGDLTEFLRTRLPMNGMQGLAQQTLGLSGNRGIVNLRGIGVTQTLMLVDGRRMGSLAVNGQYTQGDLNSIPPGLVERIEVLPATGSAIYGGGATGGVVNIITRRDFEGLDLNVGYDNTFRDDVGLYRWGIAGGAEFFDGRMNVVAAFNHAEADALATGDRDFAAQGRALRNANNPFANGAPPVGSTANIRSANGLPLVLDNGTSLGSPINFVPFGYAGPASDNGVAFVANAGRYNLEIPNDMNGATQSLLQGTTNNGAAVNIRFELTPNVELFFDASAYQNRADGIGVSLVPNSITLPANAPTNPFNAPIVVSYPSPGLSIPIHSDYEGIRALAGAIIRLPGDWAAAADLVWSRSTLSAYTTSFVLNSSFNTALTAGTVDVLRDLNATPIDYTPYRLPSPNSIVDPTDLEFLDATLRLSGPALTLPAGPLTVTGLVEWREETAPEARIRQTLNASGATAIVLLPERSQTVRSVYGEARVPIFSDRNGMPLARELDFVLAARLDAYETEAPTPSSALGPPFPVFGQATNEVESTDYMLGFRYAPFNDIVLRASFGAGFLPPTVGQISATSFNPVPPAATASLRDPERGGGLGSVSGITQRIGGSEALRPEESESLSIGAIWTPSFLPGLRVSADWVGIEKTDEVRTLTLQQLIDMEALLPGRIVRGPLTPGDSDLGYTAGPITSIDASSVNTAVTRLEAYDFQIDYVLETDSLGDFRFYALGTWQPFLKSQTIPLLPFIDSVGFTNGQLEWRGNFGVSWNSGPWSAGWNAQYFDSYRVYAATANPVVQAAAILDQGSNTVDSQLYHDLNVSYRPLSGPLANTQFSFGVQNVFDEDPPILATVAPVGGYSLHGDPRLRRFSLTVRTHF